MNSIFRKTVTTLAIAAFLCSLSSNSFAQEKFMIYQDRDSMTISSGLQYEIIRKFDSSGWTNINVLKVDLTDKYTSIKPLLSKDGAKRVDTIKNMVVDSNAIAGINADFFYYNHFSTPVGPIIKDGKFVSSTNNSTKPYPVFFVDNDKKSFIDVLHCTYEVIGENKDPLKVYSINKDGSFDGVTMFDKGWSEKTVGNTYVNDLTEVIVEDDKVISITTGQIPVDMPENGYTLVGKGFAGEQLKAYFKIGDKVKLKIQPSLDLSDIDTAIGGGALLVKDGMANNDYVINPKGNNPRTALGITKSKDQLIIVTVDGRHKNFKGLTLEEMSKLMIELGSYNAINFDGGGSTTMVLSTLDSDDPQVVNYPSDGALRKVVNGLGVFNTAPTKSLSKIEIITDSTDIMLNSSKSFSIKGYDRYNNPLPIKQDDVVYKIKGLEGSVKGNTFRPSELGSGKLYAKYKGKSAKIEVNVINEVMEIQSDKSSFDVASNKEINLIELIGTTKGLNNDGYVTTLNFDDITWQVHGEIGKIKDGIFYTSSKENSGILTAKVGQAVKNFDVSVGYNEKMLDDLEYQDNLSFTSYPSNVGGSISIDPRSKEGSNSLKMNYAFTDENCTQAAYLNLRNGGINLTNKTDKIGMWVYGNNSNHWLRAEIVDSKGKIHRLTFANHLNWSKWKWVTADIPSYLSYPITVKKIYLVETNPMNMDNGNILIDGIKALNKTPFSYDGVTPQETKVVDTKQISVEKQQGGFNVAVTTGVHSLSRILDYQMSSKYNSKLSNYDASIILDNLPNSPYENTSIVKINPKNGYSMKVFNKTTFIQVNDVYGGIRQTDAKQWNYLISEVKNTPNKNVIITLPKPVFGSEGFSDKLEADLFHQILTESKSNKDIWVVQPGKSNMTTLKDGIRYTYVKDTYTVDNFLDTQYLLFTINGDDVTYTFENLFK